MNKNLYRIVFNHSRGMLMVVPDIAGAGRAGAASSPSGAGHPPSQLIGNVHSIGFALLLALGAIQSVQAGIVADGSAPGNQQPTLISSANGTPQVNIQTPSAAGVSRNVYRQFDVDNHGVVLNNSHRNTQTQLAGLVTANPWLAKGEAKVILNEVNARDPSQLNGFIEVAGQKAQVVIANPSGITCSGCGFINANRATLTTGQVQMTNGQLTGYNVDRGEIVVQGGGLDSSLQDHTDLIARSVSINAGLWANDLAVTTGRNQVDAAHQSVSTKTADGSPRPAVAIDTAQLGGMYANKIRLLGTEAGVGVHNAGTMGATAGDVMVNVDGTLTNSGAITATQTVQLTTSGGITNSGRVYAGSDTTLQTGGALTNSGIIAAAQHTTLTAATLNSTAQGVLAAGMASDGRLGNSGNLTLNSQGQLSANGQNSAAGQLSATGTTLDFSGSQTYGDSLDLQATQGDIRTVGATLAATKTLSARTQGLLNNDSGTLSADQLSLTASSLSNQQGTVQQLGQQDLTLSHTDRINNRAGTIASNSKNLTLNTANLDNETGTLVHAGDGVLSIQVGQMNGDNGAVVSNGRLALTGTSLQLDNTTIQAGNITLNAGSLSHRGGQMTQTGSGTLNLNVTELFDNQAGTVAALGDINLYSGSLNNQQGQIVTGATGTLTVNSSGWLDNQSGHISAGYQLTIGSGDTLNNQGGLLQSGEMLTLNTHGATLLNQNSGSEGGIISHGTLTLDSGRVDNSQGVLAGQSIFAITGDLNNLGGQILTSQDMQLQTGNLFNQQGTLQAAGALTLNSQTLDNRTDGYIASHQTLTIQSTVLDNRNGALHSEAGAELRTGSLDNRAGQISAVGNLGLDSGWLQNDNAGLIQTNGDLRVDTQGAALSNSASGNGGIISQGELTLSTGALDNQQGVIASLQGPLLLTSLTLDNTGGLIQSGQSLTVDTQGPLLNRNGGLFSQGGMTLHSVQFDNTLGTVASQQALSLFSDDLLNHQGNLLSQGQLSLSTQAIDNRGGLLQSGNGLSIDTHGQALDNRDSGDRGGISSQGLLTLQLGTLDNRNGFIASHTDLQLNSGRFTNDQGTLAANSTVNLSTGALSNQSGLLQAGNVLGVDTHGNTLDNQQGILAANGSLQLLSGALLNASGQIQSGTDLLLNTQGNALDNTQGSLLALGQIDLTSGALNNQQGQIQAMDNLAITALNAVITNTQGLLRSGASLILKAAGILNTQTQGQDQGLEGEQVTLTSDSLDNRQGAIRAGSHLTLTTGQWLDNTQGLLSSAGQLGIGGSDLQISNRDGTMIAGQGLEVGAFALSGDGSLLSQGELSLTLQQDFINQGQVIANGDLRLSTLGSVSNEQLIKAGGNLSLSAVNLTNAADGEISAGTTGLWLSDSLTNRGLIDGGLTHITAGTLTNLGSGRIYGDDIALQVGTLNNLAEEGTAATLAARNSLNIGADTLNNLDHALIYSAGTLAIGGVLDNTLLASGQAAVLNNHSATIESAGDMALSIVHINNINDHLVTDVVITEQSWHYEVAIAGSPTRYDGSMVDTTRYENQYGVKDAIVTDAEGNVIARDNDFYEYYYTRTVTETQVTDSDPGQIIAGGNLWLDSDLINNNDSRIIAGGTLAGEVGQLNNHATQGQQITTDIGDQLHWYAGKSGGTHQATDKTAYQPAPVITTIDLHILTYQGNTDTHSSGVDIDGRNTSLATGGLAGPSGVTGGPTREGVALRDTENSGASLTVGSLPANQPLRLPAGQKVEIPQGEGQTVIRLISPNTRLPDNSLYVTDSAPTAHYLVETDPRFTHNQQWLGSDYLFAQLHTDPNTVLKRLGDGYYEQQLIQQQVIALTGQRYLDGFTDNENQYKALMDSGVTFAQTYGLIPGVALTPAQIALLTSDIVWMISESVTLPDGSTQNVLVPQLYARVRPGDLDGSGALLSGNNIALNVRQDLTNSGNISGRDITQLSVDALHNAGFIGGDQLAITARTDITNLGGTLAGRDSVQLLAGRDLTSSSTLGGDAANRYLDRPAGIYVQNDGGTLSLQALNNITLTASMVSNAGKDSQTQIVAGHNLNLTTLTTTQSEQGQWGSNSYRHLTQQNDVGSQIVANGDLTLQAGEDITARAATITAQDSLNVGAGHDLTLSAGESSYHLTEHNKQTRSGFLSSSSLETHDDVQAQTVQSSPLSGNTVNMQAGHDLTVIGSNVVATQEVNLTAGNNLSLQTATEQRNESHLREEKSSGLSGTGGIGFSYGSNDTKTTDDGKSQTSVGSTVGSTQGNVTLNAGNSLTVQGSDVLAGKDITLIGKEVNILAADNQSTQQHVVEQKQSGLTLALSGTVGSAVSAAVSSANDASKESNGRLAALQGMKAALSGVQAAQANALHNAGDENTSLVGVNLSYGSQSSKSEQTTLQSQSQGSTLTAGNNLNIRATGTDITVQGSQLQAGKDINLNAARDVNLLSAQNTQTVEGKNESHGGSVGVGVNFGQGKNGLTLNASVNQGKGSESGNLLTDTETTLNAGSNLNITSGRDTTLTGAQVSGEKVTMDVGRNLTLTSERDSDNYDSKQQNVSAGGSIGFGSASGSVNLSRDKMHSTYDAVQEQTGVFAGKGGFDITVGEHTQLNGAVIGSTATADKNQLDTGTLGFSDIHNQAEYDVEHQSVGISSGGPIGGQFAGNMANGLLTGVNGSESASSTTKSAISDGTIIIRDQDKQTQNVDNLSRDVANANPGLDKIFDLEKEQNRLKEAQMLGDIGSQVADIARTQGDINGLQAAKEKHPTLTADQLRQTDEYKGVMKQYGTGSALQQGIQAATAAIQGLAGGDMAKALAGVSAPYLAEVIHNMTTDANGKVNTEANLMAHAVLGAVVAYAGGNSALAGASGAVMGEYIAQQLYPGIKREDLSEAQRQTISALGTLAAGLVGGVAGDSAADAVAGGQAGKNALENNALSDIANAVTEGKTLEQKAQEQVAEENERYKQQNCAGMSAEACSVNMYKERKEALKDIASMGVDFVPVIGDLKSFAEAESALDYLVAAIGVIPGAGDAAGKIIKAAETALKKGDVTEASKLINQASGEISASSSANYAKLKDDLRQQNLDNIAKQDPRLEAVVKGDNGKLNYGVGSGTKEEADRLGQIWVGEGSRPTSDGTGLVSADGTRIYRSPKEKPNTPGSLNPTGTQANFESYTKNIETGKMDKVGNGHLNISGEK